MKKQEKKSEQMQPIYRMHEPCIKTEFGDRAMTEIGVIKGLVIDKTINYLLIPIRNDSKETTGWTIHRLVVGGERNVESWNELEELKKEVKN